MSLIIALGTNLGDRLTHLELAQQYLKEHFQLVKASRVYQSAAVDHLDQPDFYNQVIEFKQSPLTPHQVIEILLGIETQMGRKRDIPKGPRVIDLDLLFSNLTIVQTPKLSLPHPRLWQRGFVVRPLRELPFYSQLAAHFYFQDNFIDDAHPL